MLTVINLDEHHIDILRRWKFGYRNRLFHFKDEKRLSDLVKLGLVEWHTFGGWVITDEGENRKRQND